jgi:uncharacterized membrane protein YphA (DoxX/SURF4 family)
MAFLDRHAAKIFGLTRIVAGLLFLMVGLLMLPNLVEPYTHGLLPWIAVIVWIGGGACIATGFFSRHAALFFAAFMIMSACAETSPISIAARMNEIELYALSLLLLLAFASAGPGAFAVNRK